MRLLVCGGRDFNKYNEVYVAIEKLNPDVVIQGGARGADSLAKNAARWLGYKVEEYPAQWERYGKSAGYKRNQQMLDEGKPDMVLAFPGGKGTAMMVDIAKRAGVKVQIEVENATD